MERYTHKSHWHDILRWYIPLKQLADENGNIPSDGQYVTKEVVVRLAELEDMFEHLQNSHITPDILPVLEKIVSAVPPARLRDIIEAETEGRLIIVDKE